MKYALNLAEDGRVLSVTFPEYAPEDAILVDTLPEGDAYEHRYVEGEFVYDPITVPPAVAQPTQLDRIEAQVSYTAMMTGTLLEA